MLYSICICRASPAMSRGMRHICYALIGACASISAVFAAPPVIVEQHMVVRIRTYSSQETPRPIVWKEHHGPKCVRLDSLGGAAVTQPSSVDLVLRGGQHIRALLESPCAAQDYFYAGFYVAPTSDGQMCAGRDVIHARIGGDCAITKFRELTPQKQ